MAERPEQTGGEQGRGQQGLGQSEGRGVLGRCGDLVRGGPPEVGVAGVGGGALLGQVDVGGAAAATLAAAALSLAAALCLAAVAGLRVVADLPAHLGRHLGGVVRHLDEVAATRVAGHLHDPAGPDQTGLGQPRTVRLHTVLVELEDLLVAAAVAQVPLGDLPQGVVVTPSGGWIR